MSWESRKVSGVIKVVMDWAGLSTETNIYKDVRLTQATLGPLIAHIGHGPHRAPAPSPLYRVSGLSCPEAGGCKSVILRGFPDVFSLFGP